MIGRELGKRYEVIERVGGGGMAIVYKAHDSLLNRKVAVKVLRQQYTNDDDFIRRFRREAQAAASLSHPNIVSIYDVGQDDDVYYIVMEYIEGSTLNDKIKEKAPLQIEEAVHIASQICDALDHAHQNEIIHRDIKPHNILIGKNGRIKVTDFGIARATASTDITQTGAVLGSVHYFSPEHAKGVVQGAKSDLYSLGIVLYQMLTGKLPFIGDSPISVALKHLQEKVEEPRKVNPLIPQSVENIILRAVRKNPEERYASAKQMLEDLDTCLLPDRRVETKALFAATEDQDDERTLIIPAVRHDQRFPNQERNQGMERQNSKRWAEIDDEKPSRAWIKPLIWVVLVIALLLTMWYGVMWLKAKFEVPDVIVPDVVDMTIDDAKVELTKVNLRYLEPFEYEISDVVAKDVVISQDKVGITAKENTYITLVVSSGPDMAFMEDYVGLQWKEVELTLKAKYEDAKDIKADPVENDAAEGTVLSQFPAFEEEFNPKETEIIITVSKGPGTIPMPDLTKLTLEPAKVMLEKVGLKLAKDGIKKEKTYTPKDYIYKQFPYQPNELVEPGSEITLFISDGLPDDAVEDLKSVTVAPTNPGEKTTVKILVTDAAGDSVEWGTTDITEEKSFTIRLVLSPKKNAVISIYSNDTPYDTLTVTYSDAKKRQSPEYDVEEGDPPVDGDSVTDPMVDLNPIIDPQ
ncbi:MAG: Stk1 family PASTA domain-containing Ser/Thr kinase [Paenibacillaceae bacterium]